MDKIGLENVILDGKKLLEKLNVIHNETPLRAETLKIYNSLLSMYDDSYEQNKHIEYK